MKDLGSGKARDFQDKAVCAEADLVLLEDGRCVHFTLEKNNEEQKEQKEEQKEQPKQLDKKKDSLSKIKIKFKK